MTMEAIVIFLFFSKRGQMTKKTRFYISVTDDIKKALLLLSQRELRDPREQAVFLIRQKLEELALLEKTEQSERSTANDNND